MVSLHLPDLFRSKARVYAPDDVRRVLHGVASSPEVALCLDVDALERSRLARVDGVMLLALEALREHIPIVLLAWDANERATLVRAALPGTVRCLHAVPRRSLAPARSALPGRRMIVITDAPDLIADLAGDDCALLLGGVPHAAQRNVARIRELEVRAVLWWLADARFSARKL